MHPKDSKRSRKRQLGSSLRQPQPGESIQSRATQLCPECGLCCDGTIFADVKLQLDDDSHVLDSLLPQPSKSRRLPQPCPAFDGHLCSIYQRRPAHCRLFECHLLQDFHTGTIDYRAALQRIQRAKRITRRIKRLLAALGDKDQELSLAKRFRNTTRRVGQGPPNRKAAALYSDLTLAVLSLNLLLSEHFYDPARSASI